MVKLIVINDYIIWGGIVLFLTLKQSLSQKVHYHDGGGCFGTGI